MWKQVVAPTVLVVVIWLIFSTLTSIYMLWTDQTQSRLLEENVSSIRAAAAMQDDVAKMERLAFDSRLSLEARKTRLEELNQNFRSHLNLARESALAPREPEVVAEISRRFEQFGQKVRSWMVESPPKFSSLESAHDAVEWTMEPCIKLQELNADMLEFRTRERQRLSAAVFIGRNIVLILGPALGIGFGLRISRRLHRSISEISITLKDAAGALDREIGSVNLSTNVELPDLHRQVQAVGLRIRQILDELQSARYEVLRSERLAAVGELAAGVAHELRNPMTSVKLLLQTAMQRNRGQNDRQFQIILEEFARMESTIQGLLDFARPSELRRVSHDVRQTVQRALNLTAGRAHQQNVELQVDLCEMPLEISGDPEQLHQVFVNLLLNGLESLDAGGRLTVAVGPCSEGQFARIRLEDNGRGIPPDVLPRLFEPFVTTKDRGTGLGLAISRRIIENHHGRLWGANRPEGGAMFVVELPLIAPAAKFAATNVQETERSLAPVS